MIVNFLMGKVKLTLSKLVSGTKEAERAVFLTHPELIAGAKLVVTSVTGEEFIFNVETDDMEEIKWEATDEYEADVTEEFFATTVQEKI